MFKLIFTTVLIVQLMTSVSSVQVNPRQMVPTGANNNPVNPGREGIDYAFDQWAEVPLGHGPFLSTVFNNITGNAFGANAIYNLTFYDMQVRTHLYADTFDFNQNEPPIGIRQSGYGQSKLVGTRWVGHFGIRVGSFRAYFGNNANNCTIIGLSRPKYDDAINSNYLWIRYSDVFIRSPFQSVSNEEWKPDLPVKPPVPKQLEFVVKVDPNCKVYSPGYGAFIEYGFNEMPELQAELRRTLHEFMWKWYNDWVITPYATKYAKVK